MQTSHEGQRFHCSSLVTRKRILALKYLLRRSLDSEDASVQRFCMVIFFFGDSMVPLALASQLSISTTM